METASASFSIYIGSTCCVPAILECIGVIKIIKMICLTWSLVREIDH